MAILSWPDITFPTRGFEPKEGTPYTYTKVRHPEQPRYEYKEKKYVVCTATPVVEKAALGGGMGEAFASLGL